MFLIRSIYKGGPKRLWGRWEAAGARNIKITERTQFSAGSLVGERFVDTRDGVSGAGLDGNVVPAAEIVLAIIFFGKRSQFCQWIQRTEPKKEAETKPIQTQFGVGSGRKDTERHANVASLWRAGLAVAAAGSGRAAAGLPWRRRFPITPAFRAAPRNQRPT